MIYSILEIIILIVVSFCLGVVAKKMAWFDKNGCAAIKKVIMNVMLPLSLFNALMTSTFNSSTVLTLVIICVAMYSIFGAGYLLRKLVPGRKTYFPFAVSSWEGGSIGVPLALLAFGKTGMAKMAIFNFGHAFFFFVFAIPLIQIIEGRKPSVKEVIKIVFTTPVFDAIILGAIAGATGLGQKLELSPFGPVFSSLVSKMSGSLSFLVIMTVGYNFRISKDNLKDILVTTAVRIVLFSIAGTIVGFLLFSFIPFDRELLKIIIVAFTLPTSYGLLIFGKFPGNEDYICGVISLSTLISLAVFSAVVILG